MKQHLLSIVVPTHNRKDVLKKTIECLCQQTFNTNDLELIVVDDGSIDGTDKDMRNLQLPIAFTYLRNNVTMGRAATRNRGIEKSGGKLILMIDDDVWATPDLVKYHVIRHQSSPVELAVVGAILPSPEIPQTAVNIFQNRHHLWCYREMTRRSDNLPYGFCKTANLSIKKETIFKINLFDEGFHHYGGEDTDLGLRLIKENIKLVFSEHALGYHYHNENIATIENKYSEYAKSIVYFTKLYPASADENNRGFFTPYYHKEVTVKAICCNIIKRFLFYKPTIKLVKTIINGTDSNKLLKYISVQYLLPIFRIQIIFQALKEHCNANRY